MGIPLFFKTLSEKYDDCLDDNIDNKNENKFFLFLDMNCLIHPCCRKVLDENYTNQRKINYEKSVIKSTFCNKIWHNEKGSKKISGFSKDFIHKRKQNFTKFDFYRLEFIFRKNVNLFKYNLESEAKKSVFIYILLLLPFKFESRIQESYNFLDYLLYRIRIFRDIL